MAVHEHFGQNDARLRQALDYDDSGGAPSSTRAGLLWVPASGKWAPRDVLLASDFGSAGGVAPLDSAGDVPLANLPVVSSGTSSSLALVRADDTRLSNARPANAHASTHGPSGSDPLLGNARPVSDGHTSATTGYNTTSTTYVAISTTVAAAFVAPPSGNVLIGISGSLAAGAAGNPAWLSFEVRTGTTVGSGTVFWAGNDLYALANSATTSFDTGRSILVPSLTAGASYHARLLIRTGAGTGYFARCRVVVIPLPS